MTHHRHTTWTLVFALAIPANAWGAEVIYVGLSRHGAVLNQLAELERGQLAEHGSSLSTSAILSRLTNSPQTDGIDARELQARLLKATQIEAEFDTPGAQRIRSEVLELYERLALPNIDLTLVAANALHDRAGSWLAEGNLSRATLDLVEAHRRFPDVPLDTRRHPPQMLEVFKRAYTLLLKSPRASVTVTTTRPGTARLDGRVLGAMNGTRTFEVPAGRYKLWLSDDTRTSLARAIDVAGMATGSVDFAMEGMFTWAPSLVASCAPTCEDALRALAGRSSVDHAIGVRQNQVGGLELLVVKPSGEATIQAISPRMTDGSPGSVSNTRKGAPWFLLPAGTAQFIQGRALAGSLFASATAGALAWHVTAVLQRRPGHEDDSRTQQNLSAGVLATVVVASILEATIHELSASVP